MALLQHDSRQTNGAYMHYDRWRSYTDGLFTVYYFLWMWISISSENQVMWLVQSREAQLMHQGEREMKSMHL